MIRGSGTFGIVRSGWNRTHLSSVAKSGDRPEDLTWELFRDTLIEQAEQGVDILRSMPGFYCGMCP